MESSVILRPGDLIIHPSKVIKTDVAISGVCQLPDGVSKNAKLFNALWQETSKTTLLFLHPRHMRIAEDCDSVRIHADYLIHRIGEALRSLMRQPVYQIDVDTLEA